MDFWSNFNIAIEKALESNKNLIIVGDLNQDLLDENESHLSSIISLNTLTNVITKPTRITRNSATLIDPVLVTDSINVKYVDILDVESNISDHKATSILINFNYKPKLCSKRKVWYYDRADFIQLNNRIFIEDWSFINDMDVNDACEQFTNKL